MAVTFSKLGEYGRLGNQMFQIAATIGIARKNGMEFYFQEWKYSKYFKSELPRKTDSNKEIFIKEKNFHYDEYFLNTKLYFDLQGYFQSEKYWEHCKDEVLSYFQFRDNFKLNTISKNDYFKDPINSIHVRRGDYLNLSDYHFNLPLEYYKKAIELLGVNEKYLIFSDDINWCKENFKGNNFIFAENNSDVEDLFLMSLCDNNIIANSSFSWCGAYLNKNKNKKVIAPSKWFGHKLNHNTSDLYLKEWILL